ncbi:serine/threonine-protein kinase chk-1-like [Oratosquilla oratoria]|uniref:serine/threonine-protein kinase chk-1-like n=1 Tax=Oratosquilla oratoria TaxID=337810 RepID=UPI003F769D54
MAFNTAASGEARAAVGLGPQKTFKDLEMGFERTVRAFLNGCSNQEREVLLKKYIEEVEVFLQAAKMEETPVESFEHISRVLKTAKIVMEEINRPQMKKRKIVEEIPLKNKKFKISNQRNIKVLKLLGRGSFGSVHLVKDTTTEVQCARKSIRIRGLRSPTKEIDIHRRLDHKNVVSFLGEDRDRKFVYIYLEYVNGGTLQDRIEPSGMEENQVQFYFKQLIRGVKYLHSKKVAHRDLKPENLLLSRTEDLKIGDFGLAVEFEKDRYLWKVCGTSGYIAPEVFTGRYRGEPADVWSCGIILFQLLTGQTPWKDAETKDVKFAIWSSSTSEMRLRRPWRSLSKKVFSLVKNILTPKRKYRATLSEIKQNSWFQG